MAEITVRNWKNETVRSLELDPALAEYPLKKHLIYEAVLAYQAAGRAGTHQTKNRKYVSGGGKKLWRQKGTGRARVGDNRSPLWRHGGTVHGPQPRDYSWNMPRKMRRNAVRSALAQMLRDGDVVCVEDFDIGSHRTGDLEKALAGALGVEKKALLVSLEEEKNLFLAARNNPRLVTERALAINIVELLKCDQLVISEEALTRLSEVLLS